MLQQITTKLSAFVVKFCCNKIKGFEMPFRPAVKSRKGVKSKYSGIYEYYKSSDPDRATKAFYIAIRDSDGKVRKVKTDSNSNPT